MEIQSPDPVVLKVFQEFIRVQQQINYPFWGVLITVNGIILSAYTLLIVIASITIEKINLILLSMLIIGVGFIIYSIHQLILNFRSFRDIRLDAETIQSGEMLKNSITFSNEERVVVTSRGNRAIYILYAEIILFAVILIYITFINNFELIKSFFCNLR